MTAAAAVPSPLRPILLACPSQLLSVEVLRQPVESAQYTSREWLETLDAADAKASMGRVGVCWDKPRVERTVTFVRDSFFAGEEFADLADAQRRAEDWCRIKAGLRIHGTIRARPAEVFALEEAHVLLPAPTERYDTPRWTTAKVHRDHQHPGRQSAVLDPWGVDRRDRHRPGR